MDQRERKPWQVNVIITAGILATVMAALVLAQLDALRLETPLVERNLPIVNVQATAVSGGQVIVLPYGVQEVAPIIVPPLLVTAGPDLIPRPENIGEEVSGPVFTVCGEVPTGWILYSVKSGETLAALATATQTEATSIAVANCLNDGQIAAGMQLLLPSQPVHVAPCGPPQWWVRYRIRPGDTLGSLAVTRGVSVDAVLTANCRDSLSLTAGQMIFLPPGGNPSPVVVPPTPPPPAPTITIVPPSPTPQPPPTSLPQPTAVAPSPTADLPSPIPPTIVPPTATPPVPPTIAPPTATPPATSAPPTSTPEPPPTQSPTEVPTAVPTDPPLTATPPPTLPPPTATTAPTATPPPTDVPPTATPEPTVPPEPTATSVPLPTATDEPEPTVEPSPAEDAGGISVWSWYWR